MAIGVQFLQEEAVIIFLSNTLQGLKTLEITDRENEMDMTSFVTLLQRW